MWLLFYGEDHVNFLTDPVFAMVRSGSDYANQVIKSSATLC